MKFISSVIRPVIMGLCSGLLLSAAAQLSGAPATVRVMSFNIRMSAAADGVNGWTHRRAMLFQTVRAFQPDLVGFQEVLANQYDELIAQLPDYAFSGRARVDGQRKGEWALLGFRRDRFRLVGQGDFWLSEQPAVIGSKSWDAMYPRICSWVRLGDAVAGSEFVFANTHFDHVGVVARQQASQLISRELSRIAAGRPAILTGDLNVTEDDPAYAVLVRPEMPGAIRWRDAYRRLYPVRARDELTFHAFAGHTEGWRIDYVLHTADFVPLAATIDRTRSAAGYYPSDHYAVTAVLQVAQP